MLSPFSVLRSTLTVDDSTSVGVQALSGDKAAVLAGKEDETCRDLTGLTRATHWGGEGLLCIFVHGRGDEWCPNYCHISVVPVKYEMPYSKLTGTRADTVDADAVADLLI